MKYFILMLLLIVVSGSQNEGCDEMLNKTKETRSVGKVIDVQYLNGGFLNEQKTIIRTDRTMIVISREHIPIPMGVEVYFIIAKDAIWATRSITWDGAGKLYLIDTPYCGD